MNFRSILRIFFTKKSKLPVLIISKKKDIREYDSIEEAIIEMENDPDIPADKLERLKLSVDKLKNKDRIKIKNGEIIN